MHAKVRRRLLMETELLYAKPRDPSTWRHGGPCPARTRRSTRYPVAPRSISARSLRYGVSTTICFAVTGDRATVASASTTCDGTRRGRAPRRSPRPVGAAIGTRCCVGATIAPGARSLDRLHRRSAYRKACGEAFGFERIRTSQERGGSTSLMFGELRPPGFRYQSRVMTHGPKASSMERSPSARPARNA